MILKLITFLFGSLSKENKEKLLTVLKEVAKAGAEGAVAGAMKRNK